MILHSYHSRRWASFTLVEILVVIVIIVLLLGLLLASLNGARQRAKHVAWASYMDGLRNDPDLMAQWTFEGQKPSDTILLNKAVGSYLGSSSSLDSPADLQEAVWRIDQQPRFEFAASIHDPDTLACQFGDGADPSTFPEWTDGRWKGKGALRFDGASWLDVKRPDPLNLGTHNFTIALWLRIDEPAPAAIIAKIGVTVPAGYALLYDGQVLWLLAIGSGVDWPDIAVSGPPYVPESGWHHYAVTRKRQGTSFDYMFYMDGQPYFSNPEIRPITNVSNDGPFLIGRQTGWGYFIGVIDEINIFRRALNYKQILDLYEAGKP